MHVIRVALCLATAAIAGAPLALAAAMSVTGVVRDSSGTPVQRAQVTLLTAEQAPVASAQTDAAGRFSVAAPSPGRYLLVVRADAFGDSHRAVAVADTPVSLDVVLHPAGHREDVTVTASRGRVDELRRAGQPINVVDDREIGARVKTVVAQAVEGEPGVHLQRTSPTMAGIFVRGLTGNKVNVFVDGVRYSNGAQRGGVNTFLDLIEPGSLDAIEVLRGPSSAQYGSDALGGSVQFLTRPPALGFEGGPRWRGSAGLDVGTAHRTGGGSTLLGYMGRSLGLTASVSGRNTGLFRPGGGLDSHAAVTRFLGVPSDLLMPSRLPDTGFHQLGAIVRSSWVAGPRTHVGASYARTNQDGGRRYDQLLGGDGNLIANLNDLSLDLFSLKIERLGAGWFDSGSVSYSVNSQREERVNQGGNGSRTATIGHEPERTTAHAIQAGATKQISPRQSLRLGADVQFEGLTCDAFNVNPLTGASSPRRPRVPSGARYTHGGVFAQTSFDVRPDRLALMGALRYGGARYTAHASDSPVVNGQPLWPDDALSASSVTFRASAVATPSDPWTVLVSVSRGFRAPHMTDLGTLGLTGSGYEVAAPDVAGLGAFVGTTADASAVSSGAPVSQVAPESSLQYEGMVGYRTPRFSTEVSVFVNTVHDNIQKQALILPRGAVGSSLGGTPITSQNANGAVFVAATTVPVLVRANFDNARIWGLEQHAEARLTRTVTATTVFTFLRAKDTATGLSPNIEGGTPAPEAWISARWTRPDGRLSVEPYLHVAWKPSHLSSLDLGDRRTGAARSRANIRAFFLNGATVRGWVGAGADGALGTADDLLTATGETLAQIQDRVLGAGVNSAPLFTSIPGYATCGVRAAFRTGRHHVTVDAENLNDENYRGVSWGMDAPGRGVSMRYAVTF